MAEERLIDDDKDRKYKIRINENGEEELVIDDVGEEDDTPVFDMPYYDGDDEEAAILSPEQLAERERIKAEEEKARLEKLAALLDKAKERLLAEDFEGANFAVSQAEELTEDSGELFCLKLKILTRNMTEFLNLEECAEAADGIKEYATAEQKAEFKGSTAKLNSLVSEAEAKTEALHKESEAGKEERRDIFLKAKRRSLAAILGTAGTLLIFLGATIVFSSFMFANENGAYLIATIVLGALAVIAFIATVIAAKEFWAAARDVKLNEKDTSTKLGREYIDSNKKLELLKRISAAFEL